MKSAELQNQINNLDEQIHNGQNEDGSRSSDAQLNLMEMTRTEKRKELDTTLAEEVSQQERVQAQEEQIGGLKETVRSIFEASFPKDETVKIMGLTEYESTQQTFNQLIDQAVDEDQSALYAAFNQQLEQRDEKIRDLTLQALETQRQLEIANEDKTEFVNLNKELADQVETQQYTIQTLEQNIEDRDNVIEQNVNEIQRLNQYVFDLQKQIANVQTIPQIIDIIPTAPSESLSERIAKAKVNSKLQLANVRWIGANWVEGINEEGNKEIAHVSEVESVIEFPIIEPVTEVVEPVKEIPFQTETEVHSAESGLVDQSQSVPGEGLEEKSEVITLESLKAEVDAIKSHLGLVA